MDITSLLKDLVPMALTGVASFGGATLRFYLRIQSLARQVEAADKRLEAYVIQQTAVGSQMADVLNRLNVLERYEIEAQVVEQIENLKKAMKLEIDNHRDDLEQMIQEVRGSIRSIEDSSHDFAKEAALAQFMAQQATRWEQIQRTLGRIEGFLKRSGGGDDRE